jgi:hypothetical protein
MDRLTVMLDHLSNVGLDHISNVGLEVSKRTTLYGT